MFPARNLSRPPYPQLKNGNPLGLFPFSLTPPAASGKATSIGTQDPPAHRTGSCMGFARPQGRLHTLCSIICQDFAPLSSKCDDPVQEVSHGDEKKIAFERVPIDNGLCRLCNHGNTSLPIAINLNPK